MVVEHDVIRETLRLLFDHPCFLFIMVFNDDDHDFDERDIIFKDDANFSKGAFVFLDFS